MMTPRVSVICIFYQAERFLAEAIESVLAQDFADWEFLLVDDGSTDGGTAIAQDYAARHPDRIRYLDHPGHANRGMSATRNRGLGEARGELITFIDADDVWRVNKLSAQLAILDANPEIGAVCGALEYWNSWNGGADHVVLTGRRHDVVCRPPDTVLDLYPLGMFPAAQVEAMVRRTVYEAIGRFEDQFPGHYEDQAFFTKVYATTPIWFSSHAWIRYRQHDESCVAQTHAKGRYREGRRAFLTWYARWIEARAIAGKARVMRAVRRELWKTGHPLVARLMNRLQTLMPDLFR